MSDGNTRFAFVILNYGTAKETERCVETVFLRTKNIACKKIIVIDNGSGGNDFAELQSKFRTIENVVVLPLEKNIGFANGNNFGYKWLSENNFFPDFTVFLNNDAYIISNDFCEQIVEEYKESGFSVAGPRIISGDNSVNSCPFSVSSKKGVEKEKRFFKWIRFFSRIRLVRFYFLFVRVKKCLTKSKANLPPDKSVRKENVLLHGSCLIFSKKYFESYKEPFDSRTFLYKEEELLFLRLQKKHLLSVFLPDLIIFHGGGVSTSKGKSLNSLWLFRSEHYIRSLDILLSEM